MFPYLILPLQGAIQLQLHSIDYDALAALLPDVRSITLMDTWWPHDYIDALLIYHASYYSIQTWMTPILKDKVADICVPGTHKAHKIYEGNSKVFTLTMKELSLGAETYITFCYFST